jgi:hypothetical protein
VFENRVLKRIFGPKRNDVTGEWRILHDEDLDKLYPSPNIITQIKMKRMRWAGHVECMGEERKVYRVLVGKPEGKRPLGRPRNRWEDWIRMVLGRLAGGGSAVDSAGSGEVPEAGGCVCGDEPSDSGTRELVYSN